MFRCRLLAVRAVAKLTALLRRGQHLGLREVVGRRTQGTGETALTLRDVEGSPGDFARASPPASAHTK